MQFSRVQRSSTARLTTGLSTLSEFLAEPTCRQCGVLEICFAHLLEDAAAHHSSYAKRLSRALHGVVPFASNRRSGCCRCVPAEILAAYLTPGEELVPRGGAGVPILSWLNGTEDMHW